MRIFIRVSVRVCERLYLYRVSKKILYLDSTNYKKTCLNKWMVRSINNASTTNPLTQRKEDEVKIPWAGTVVAVAEENARRRSSSRAHGVPPAGPVVFRPDVGSTHAAAASAITTTGMRSRDE